jgi:hypothetical protein
MSETNLPALSDLLEGNALTVKENKLMVILNQPPPDKWLKTHPFVTGHRYLAIEHVEYLLTAIYTKWWVEVLSSKVVANSMVVEVRVFVKNPLTGEIEHQDGIGAAPIQTKKDAGAMDWNQAQTNGVQMAAPMAKTYAIKDAAEEFGKIFGRDVARKNQLSYDKLLKKDVDPMVDRFSKLIDSAKTTEDLDELGTDEDFPTVLNDKIQARYAKLNNPD